MAKHQIKDLPIVLMDDAKGGDFLIDEHLQSVLEMKRSGDVMQSFEPDKAVGVYY